MSENNFKLKVQAVLDKVKSVANIKTDIKAIESKLPKLKIQGTLNTTSTRKELNSKLKSIKPKVKVDADTTQAEKKIKKIGKQKTNATITPTVDTAQVVSGLKKAQKETKTLWERFVSGAIGANLVRMSVQKVTQAIHEAVKAVKKLDTIKTNIQMVSGTTNSEVNSMMQSYNAMAKELSSTTKEVGEAANEFLRMGESVASTNELIKNATILSKVGMIDSADAASYLISSMKGYQVSAEDSIDIVSKLTAVDLEAAVSAGGLAEAISRCSNIANNSGTSMNRLIGYAASIGEVTQESMSVVGNSLKSMYSRMNNIKIGRFIDDETGESLSDTEAVLNKLGIKLRDTENTYRDFDDVLDDVGKNWKDFTQVEQNAISVAIAGTMQRERFTALMNNYSSALEYSEVAANSAGSALERYGVYQDSIEAKTNELTAAIESLSTNIVSEELYSGIVQATTGLVEFLDKTNLLKGTLAGLVAMGVSKAIVSIGTGFITAAKSTAQLSVAMALLKGERSADNLMDIGLACKGLSNNQLKLILSTKGLRTEQRLTILEGMGLEEQERKQMLTTLGLAEAENVATASTLSFKSAWNSLRVAFASNPIGFIITGIATAVSIATMAFTGFNNAMEDVRQKAKDMGGELKNTKADIEDYKVKIAELYKTINDSGSSISDVTEARRNLMTIQDELIDKYGIEKAAINDITDAVDGQSEAFDRLAGKQWQEAKNGFNDGGFMNNFANWVEGYKDNIERMVAEMENVREVLSYSHTDYQNADYTELKQLLENLGWTYNYSLGGFEKNGSLKELYNEILEVQRLAENFDAPQKFIDDLTDSANGAKEVIDSYGDMWDTYILQDRIFANGELADSWHEVNEAYSDYQKAFVSGDEESITRAKETFAEIITRATEGLDDQSVIDYFNNMYPELQSVVGEWKFNTAFDAYTDDLQTKVQSALDALKDENGRSLTAEEILGLNPENQQYQALISIAHSYNMTLEEMIELLKERNLVSAMDYQGLVGLFGQDNVDNLSPKDLEIAYQVKNIGNMTFEQLQAEIQRTKEVTKKPVV